MQRLEARRPELERATLDRVYGIGNPVDAADPEYSSGLRSAVSAALFHGISAIGHGGQPSIPPQLLMQARQAVRHSVSLDTVLRRYFAGFTMLGDFLIEEVEQAGAAMGSELKRLLRVEGELFDRLLVTISEEYAQEVGGRPPSLDRRRAEHVRRLLAGELSDLRGLEYDLDMWHLAGIGSGPGADEAVRSLASASESQLLLIRIDPKTVWAWLGAPRKGSILEALRLAEVNWPAPALLALGEPGEGLPGWRLGHQQAAAAMSIARRRSDRVVRYGDVSMLASALHDEVLSSSLKETYLVPLEQVPDGGVVAKRTLFAYLAANRNASSAAAALGVSRKTVRVRLRSVEEKIGKPLDRCAPELETALRLGELGDLQQ